MVPFLAEALLGLLVLVFFLYLIFLAQRVARKLGDVCTILVQQQQSLPSHQEESSDFPARDRDRRGVFDYASPPALQHLRGQASQRSTVKSPPTFSGASSEFKEWVFSVELALKSLRLPSSDMEANYAASYLEGNARLWLMTSLESGDEYGDWHNRSQI